jgi:hypothetical protein
MKEAFEDAVQELKRVDHLFWVSLKYTRTVDMIKHVIERIISCMTMGMESVLRYAKEKKMISEIPENIGLKIELVKKTFPDNREMMDYINFYQLMRKLSKADYKKKEEFRRHVTMIAAVDGNIVNVDIDTLKEYYEKLKVFMRFVKRTINEEKEEQA